MLLSLLLAVSQDVSDARLRERCEVNEKDTWKLDDIYPSDDAWEQARLRTEAEFDKVTPFEGTLSRSSRQLLSCLDLMHQIDKELSRLYCYISMKSDQDTRNSQYQGMKQQLQQINTDYNTRIAFIEPEILSMDKALIDRFVQEQKGLEPYRMYLNDILRTQEHRLSDKEEKILAQTGMIASAPSTIYSIFSDAELPYPKIVLSDGTEALLNKAGYSLYRASRERSDREAVFDAFWKTFYDFGQTFGAQLASQVKKDMFYARVRQYDSSLHSALDRNNIPVEVYHSLVENVNLNLDAFHRYLQIKRRLLGVEQLQYSDIYAPAVKGVDLEYTYDQARDLVLKAFTPLGDEYVNVVKRAFKERWIDVYPTHGKRSGAYSNGGCYDVHPYILLNYNGQYEDVSTLAHELGHTMHSYCSNKNQPYATADYAIFVAEVASTLNEALLMDMVLKTVQEDEVRLSLLMNYLDGLKGTVFRQTQFAEFELAIHQALEKGKALTGDSLTELYGQIVRRYYGHDKGICRIKDLYCTEWAYIPHLYYDFYVYQYATSFTASTALSEKILAGDQEAVHRYLAFISSGASDYPIALLKQAGVDMMSSEPFDRTMDAMDRAMDQIERILDKRGV